MDSYERLWAAAHLKDYDRPPFCDNEWNEILGEMTPLLAGCLVRADRQYSEDERAAAVCASMDMIPWSHIYDHPRYPVLGPIPRSREGELRVDADGFHHVAHGYTEWITQRPFHDLPGFLAYLERKAAQARRERPRLPEDFGDKLRYARRMLPGVRIGLPYLGAGLDSLYPLAGWEIMAQAVSEAPQAIADYLAITAERTARWVHLYAEQLPASECPVALGAYSDIACNHGLLLSPAFLRRALAPAVRILAAAYHEHGIQVVYHSEGNIRQFLAGLIEAGVDGINPLSPSEGMDAVEIRQLYPRLILWGGIDERAVLVNGSPEQFRTEVHRVVHGVGRGLILGSSGGVHPAIPAENAIAMVQALRTRCQSESAAPSGSNII
jgi:hypothetical protein